jgi:ribose transport system permease protein
VSPKGVENDLLGARAKRSTHGAHLVEVSVKRYGLVAFLICLVIGFSLAMPTTFATRGNLDNILSTQTVVLMLTLGLLLPLNAGDFDLSIGANLVFTATLDTLIINDLHLNPTLAIFVGVAIGGIVGLVNAFLIVIIKLNGFITTLAVMTVLGAVSLGMTNAESIILNTNALYTATSQQVFGIPVGVYYVWLAALLLWYVLEKTPWGSHLRMTGSARDSSRLMGLPTNRIRISAFVVAGLMCGVAAFFLLGSVGSIDPSSSGDYLLEPFAAAFLGTAVAQIGFFNVTGSFVAIYIIVVGSTGLQILGVSAWAGTLFQGLVLIAGLLLARLASGRSQDISPGDSP